MNVKGSGKGEVKNKFLYEYVSTRTEEEKKILNVYVSCYVHGIDDCDLRLLCHGCELQPKEKSF